MFPLLWLLSFSNACFLRRMCISPALSFSLACSFFLATVQSFFPSLTSLPLSHVSTFLDTSCFSVLSQFLLSPFLLHCFSVMHCSFIVCAFLSFLECFLSLFHHHSLMDAISLSFSLACFLLGILTLSLSHALSQVLFHHAFSFSLVCFPAMSAPYPALHIYNICFPLFSCALSALSILLLTLLLSPPTLYTSLI